MNAISRLAAVSLLSIFTAPSLLPMAAGAGGPAALSVDALASPAPEGSGQPQLAVGADGTVYLTWLEKSGDKGHRFRFASLPTGARAWSAPATIFEGEGFFANWADVPSMTVAPDGMMAAHWLQVSGSGKYAYDVRVRTSRDDGRTWSAPFTAHTDRTPAEHGFASFYPWAAQGKGTDGIGLAWLDGRTHGRMSLRTARIEAEGARGEVLIDDSVCDCCPTSAALTSRGVAVAYRDRSPEEIRDIYVARLENGKWTKGRPVSRDNWQIAGCPVNGPSLSAAGDRVALAWFAAPDNEARVSIAFSRDAAVTFGSPTRVDDGNPLGRVDAELLPDGSALVGWIEQLERGAEFRVRRVTPDGQRGAAQAIAPLASGRASGYPRIARSGNRLVFAWVGDKGVMTAAGAS